MHDKKSLHYLSGALNRRFFLNLKENPELLSQDEFESICFEMLDFQEKNNRLSFADGEDAPRIIKMDEPVVLAPVDTVALEQLASKPERSLMGSLRGLFRSP